MSVRFPGAAENRAGPHGERRHSEKDFEDCFLICFLFLYASRVLCSSSYLCLEPEIFWLIKMEKNLQLRVAGVGRLSIQCFEVKSFFVSVTILLLFLSPLPPPCTSRVANWTLCCRLSSPLLSLTHSLQVQEHRLSQVSQNCGLLSADFLLLPH